MQSFRRTSRRELRVAPIKKEKLVIKNSFRFKKYFFLREARTTALKTRKRSKQYYLEFYTKKEAETDTDEDYTKGIRTWDTGKHQLISTSWGKTSLQDWNNTNNCISGKLYIGVMTEAKESLEINAKNNKHMSRQNVPVNNKARISFYIHNRWCIKQKKGHIVGENYGNSWSYDQMQHY